MSTLVDTAARERIITGTSAGLFVEAGAGSGKTRSLVERIVTLVMVDGARLAEVAAVTFTEKAGAELRDRLRAEFERRWQDARHAGGHGAGRAGGGTASGTDGAGEDPAAEGTAGTPDDPAGEGTGDTDLVAEEDRAARALDDLDSAAIGTLHSFAQRILTMHPIEAGLPPLVEVMDEV
ncbi:MAG TPA: UvrD-helicase domain-containing protein, partial [Actinomycetaceae bacterium]|nr:UvrD-helicase domain-containing protein [Actinomycetaceae bacterium]